MINVQDHLALAKKQAGQIFQKLPLDGRYEYDDILQICYLGLMKAAERFDGSKGYRFSTYACNCMYGYVLNVVQRDKFYPAKDRYKHLDAQVFSLDVKIKDCDKKETTYKEILVDTEDIETTFNGILVRTALEKLPDKHKKVISLKYLNGKSQRKLQIF